MNWKKKIVTAGIAMLLSGFATLGQTVEDNQPAVAISAPAAFGEFTDVALTSAPEWTSEGNSSVARLTLRHADAAAWKVNFRSLSLPQGAQMFLYGTDASTGAVASLHGPFEGNGPLNIPSFTTDLIGGANLTVEIRSAARLVEWPFQLESVERISAARLAELQQHGIKVQSRVTPPTQKPNGTPDVRTTWVGDRLVTYELTNGDAISEGDIVLTNVAGTKSDRKGSHIVTAASSLWPGAKIPYSFAGTIVGGTYEEMDPSLQWTIQQAIDYWNGVFPGILKPRTNEADSVSFRFASGVCQSSVGRVGGGQTIELSTGCSVAAVIHEIGHAAGLHHEHQRSDRDEYIKVNLDNVTSGKKHNFTIPTSNAKTEGAYDFASIMHYGTHGFSSNGKPTIEALVYLPAGVTMGAATTLSAGDQAGIKKLYCSGALTTGPSLIEVDGLTDTYSFNITMPSICTWSLSVTGSWITVTSAKSGKGSTTVTFKASTNTSLVTRTGSIKYAGKTTTLKQESLYAGY